MKLDDLLKAHINNVIRLANFLKIDTEKYKNCPNKHWKIAIAILRWYKKNPVKKKKYNLKL